MPSALKLRTQIEAALSNRVPSALSPIHRIAPSLVGSGIMAIDELLQGGLPCGVITELVGQQSSGRTTMATAFMASITKSGSVCAWVDASDTLDPETAAANGVDLDRLLWVRCGYAQAQAAAPVFASSAPAISEPPSQPRHSGGGSPHPRSEGRDMPSAIQTLLKSDGVIGHGQLRREKRSIGTPGAPNRPIAAQPIATQPKGARPKEREEQVNSDRMPPRRGDNLAIAPRCAEPLPHRVANVASSQSMAHERLTAVESKVGGRPWDALDQAIRSTDLLLQSGGFGAIVLDLGSTPPEMAWRIPLATWFRYRAACERSRTSLLLLTQHACARSSAELVVRLEAGTMESTGKVMTGVYYHAATERNRAHETNARIIPIRKPPQSEQRDRPGHWVSEAAWAQVR